MPEKKESLSKALLDLLKTVLYIILLLFGFITCFFGLLMFAGLNNKKEDAITLAIMTLVVEGAGVLMLYLAGRLIGKNIPDQSKTIKRGIVRR